MAIVRKLKKKSEPKVNSNKCKAAIYTRVSTEDQAKEGFSLDAQLDRLRSYCSAREWEIAHEYIDDGYSGRKTNRPAYQLMFQEMGKWDVLLVLKMDRIHRNSKNFMEMMDTLVSNNKEFVSMNESLDTSTAMGRFVMDIIQRIAQLESEQIGERVFYGMEQKAKTPLKNLDPKRSPYLGFNHPYGYDYENGALTINPEESIWIERIFNYYKQGKSLGEIVEYLEEQNVVTKRGKKNWSRKTISRILKNPIYCGMVEWNAILNEGAHDSIISIELFNAVQEIFKHKGKFKGVIEVLKEAQ